MKPLEEGTQRAAWGSLLLKLGSLGVWVQQEQAKLFWDVQSTQSLKGKQRGCSNSGLCCCCLQQQFGENRHKTCSVEAPPELARPIMGLFQVLTKDLAVLLDSPVGAGRNQLLNDLQE